MMKYLISIIIPCYNQAQYLDECLQSVLEQSYENWECLIINDGSPDHTEEVAEKWISKDIRFTYYKKENGGVSSARNFGIEKSKGEWILPLDADDKIADKYLEKASAEFLNADIVYCKANYFGDKSGKIKSDDFSFEKTLLENQIFCTAFFEKISWESIKGFDEEMHDGYEDWEFWLRLISLKGNQIMVKRIDYTGFFYRIKETSRNSQAMGKNDSEIKKYIYAKHQHLYHQNIDKFAGILHENRRLKLKIDHLNEVLNSKRYLFVNKIFNLFKR